MKQRLKSPKHPHRRMWKSSITFLRRYKFVVFIVLFALIGAGILLAIHAASPSVSVEPETGTVNPPAANCNDASASNGACVTFGGIALPMQGNINRIGQPPANYSNVGAYVIEVQWDSLQPVSDADIGSHTGFIDRELAYAKANHLRLKIRLMAGDCTNMPSDLAPRDPNNPATCAPDPTDVTVNDTSGGSSGGSSVSVHVAHYWESNVIAAYDNLMQQLAQKYDNKDSGLNEITDSLCMSVYAEPFLTHNDDPTTVQDYLQAGYTDAKGQNCIKQSIDIHAKYWHYVRTGIAFNPWGTIDGTPASPITGSNENFTDQMIAYCREPNVLGQRCVLENNSIRASTKMTTGSVYAKIQSMGPPISLQTAATPRICGTIAPKPSDHDCLVSTINFATNCVGSNAVELPGGFDAYISDGDLGPLQTLLMNNPTDLIRSSFSC